MVTLRACVGPASRAAMTASRATVFQSVMTSARAEVANNADDSSNNASDGILRCVLMIISVRSGEAINYQSLEKFGQRKNCGLVQIVNYPPPRPFARLNTCTSIDNIVRWRGRQKSLRTAGPC